MIMLPLLLLLAAEAPDNTAFDQWRSCVRSNAASYEELKEAGQPQETQRDFVEANCWKERATATLALEPAIREMLLKRGITKATTGAVGMIITDTLDRLRDEALGPS